MLKNLGWRFCSMAKLVYVLNESLDGYVDHMKIGPPDPALSRHFIEQARGLTGAVYGRRMYEIMRYWDDDLPDWDAEDRDFATVWRGQRGGGVWRAGEAGGAHATPIEEEFEAGVPRPKSPVVGGSGEAPPKHASTTPHSVVFCE